jgi:hypothetical protein
MSEYCWVSENESLDRFVRGKNFASWFNLQYELCKLQILRKAEKDGITQDELSFRIEMRQDLTDIEFVATGRVHV